tara:strand:+ start:1730 stop:2245 length:516 start_codon:yes stop_codon:yes gene_type:complete
MNQLKQPNKNHFLSIFKFDQLICLLVVTLIFFLDRYSKIKIINLQIDNGLIYINEFINFELVWNTGIGFGLLSSNSNIVYNSITAIIGIILIILILIILRSSFYEKLLFSLILGGALGNFYDRIVYFAVPDFIDIHYQRFHWFTFNIADIFITFGVLLLLFNELFLKNGKN